MHYGNLSWIYNGFSVKAHGVNQFHFLSEAFHILQIGINGIKALYSCGSGMNNHQLPCTA